MPAYEQMRSESDARRTIARAAEGDMDALGELYREHSQAVMRVAYHLMASRDEAEDIVQDVFIGLPEALRKLDDPLTFPSWLRRVAARTALMRMRGERRRRQSPIEGAAASAAPAHDGIERDAIAGALASLPEELRTVFVLKEIEGYAHAEIATLAGITVNNSEVRLHRARVRLRKILGG